MLRPGGRMLLSTHGMFIYHPDPVDYWRWTCAGLRHVVEEAGFRVVRFEGVIGLLATGLQFVQDATYYHLPRPLRPVYAFVMQSLVALADRLQAQAAGTSTRRSTPWWPRSRDARVVRGGGRLRPPQRGDAALGDRAQRRPAGCTCTTCTAPTSLRSPNGCCAGCWTSAEPRVTFLDIADERVDGTADRGLHRQGHVVPAVPARAAPRRRPGAAPGRRPDRGRRPASLCGRPTSATTTWARSRTCSWTTTYTGRASSGWTGRRPTSTRGCCS